jgi:hypothetical protein
VNAAPLGLGRNFVGVDTTRMSPLRGWEQEVRRMMTENKIRKVVVDARRESASGRDSQRKPWRLGVKLDREFFLLERRGLIA